MQRIVFAATLSVLGAGFLTGAPALAQKAAAPAAAATAADLTDGEVRKIDKAAKKVVLKHGEIKNLGMPGMTMSFPVKDPALLEGLKEGDKVKFHAEMAGKDIVVTSMQPAK